MKTKLKFFVNRGPDSIKNQNAVKTEERRTCPLLSICEVSNSITICCNEKTSGVFTYAKCSIPIITEMKMVENKNNGNHISLMKLQ